MRCKNIARGCSLASLLHRWRQARMARVARRSHLFCNSVEAYDESAYKCDNTRADNNSNSSPAQYGKCPGDNQRQAVSQPRRRGAARLCVWAGLFDIRRNQGRRNRQWDAGGRPSSQRNLRHGCRQRSALHFRLWPGLLAKLASEHSGVRWKDRCPRTEESDPPVSHPFTL